MLYPVLAVLMVASVGGGYQTVRQSIDTEGSTRCPGSWSTWAGTECTCIYLAAAGALDGARAATHWASAQRLTDAGVTYSDERVVRPGRRGPRPAPQPGSTWG